jgi:hypothetical protein
LADKPEAETSPSKEVAPVTVELRESTMLRIKMILQTKLFVFLAISISGLYFIVTGI